jgi:hypothetical protein
MTEIFDEPTAIVPVEPQPAAVFNPVTGTTAFDLAQRIEQGIV